MLADYAPLLVLLAFAVGLGVIVMGLAHFIGPRVPSPVKTQAYESGMTSIGGAQRRVPVRYYLIATLFILFDIEVIYLYPWAVEFRALVAKQGLGALGGMAVFLGVLLVGYIYVWREGALEWD
ncbi:MAG: NADH-quinone oxidoreductase subunit A [Ardenticatenales bacterium]